MIALVSLVVGAEKADNFGVQCVTVLSAAAATDEKNPLRVDPEDRMQMAAAEFLVTCGLLRESSLKSQVSKCFEATGEGRVAYRRIVKSK